MSTTQTVTKENAMKQIRIDKVTVNMGVGQSGEELEKAVMILKKITDAKPIKTLCKVRAPTWGIRIGLPIGAKVTLRKKMADKFLTEAFKAKDNSLKERNFDKTGNFGFGVKEYIDLPNIKYDPKFGIRGFDVLVTLERPGARVKKRKIAKHRIAPHHRISKKEAIEFVKSKYGVEVE